ncbi:MAG: Crp/Fnr family transcriptional regulator [Alphaproteobacteria bacterium]|nr:Crp/Fnr family transcriptional regulator [Alphaproteobacteria bacterium]
MKTKSFKAGQRIISKGEKASTAYLITKGSVHVFLEKEGKIVTLAELGPWVMFGEAALVGLSEYGAHVEATEDNTEVAVITPESFQEKLKGSDPMIKAIIDTLIERLRKTNDKLLDSETRAFVEIAFV